MSHPQDPRFDLETMSTPANAEEASDNLRKLAEMSRRSFLGRGLAATALPAGLIAASAKSASAASTNTRSLPSYVSGGTHKYFQQIQADEATHVNIVTYAIRTLGGTPRPFPSFQGITVSDPQQLLNLAMTFENTGVRAYFSTSPYVSNPAVLNVAASLLPVEAYHAGFLNVLANQSLVPGGVPYATPITLQQLIAAVSPFIADLNDGGMFPVGFSTTPSPQNDIAILNTALILEYLEAAFYYYSVERTFAGSK